jgi:hypothetical protein
VNTFPDQPITPTMRPILIGSTLCLGLTAGFWYSLTSSLTDMTIRDCQAGVQRACDQLKKDGVQP